MAIINFEAEDQYFTKTASSEITVTAQFGEGQPGGGYVIFLNQEMKGSNETTLLGTAASLQGKWTLVAATIIDKLEETNWLSLTITINEGTTFSTKYGPYKKLVPNHLDAVSFLIKILNV